MTAVRRRAGALASLGWKVCLRGQPAVTDAQDVTSRSADDVIQTTLFGDHDHGGYSLDVQGNVAVPEKCDSGAGGTGSTTTAPGTSIPRSLVRPRIHSMWWFSTFES